jgi:hypothetical protein
MPRRGWPELPANHMPREHTTPTPPPPCVATATNLCKVHASQALDGLREQVHDADDLPGQLAGTNLSIGTCTKTRAIAVFGKRGESSVAPGFSGACLPQK